MSVVPVSEARATLPEILDRVLAGEEVTITRHGKQAAVLVHPDALRVRRANHALEQSERLQSALDRGRDTSLGDTQGISTERAEDLVAALAADRAAR
ncbi:MAG: type II toxin-antitoxin system Phd/YefM family antitoxin [Microthrixaceae bacterium]